MSAARVLIADDEVNLCRVLQARLRQSGLECLVAHDGVQVLDILRSQPVDAVVLDVRLPRLNGVQLLREIRKQCPQLPCILMTAFEDPALHEEAVRLGANAVLQKPFDLEAFTELVWREVRATSPATRAHMLLHDGERVVVDLRAGSSSYAYTSRVLWQDDRTLEVEPPLAAIDAEALAQGVAIVQFVRGDGLYQFRSRARLVTAPRLALHLSKPVSIRRVQRRRYPRVVEQGVVSLAFAPPGEREAAPITLTGELYDLSRKGFSVLLSRVPPIGEEVSFQLTLPQANLTLIGQARVVSAGDVVIDRVPAVYRVGLEFIQLASAMRQALAEWLESALTRR